MRLGTFAFSPVLPRGSNFQIFEDSRKAAVREELRRHLLTALHCSADGRACLSSHRRRHGQSTAAGVDLAVTRRTVLEPPQLGLLILAHRRLTTVAAFVSTFSLALAAAAPRRRCPWPRSDRFARCCVVVLLCP